jgi:hypothetical protein
MRAANQKAGAMTARASFLALFHYAFADIHIIRRFGGALNYFTFSAQLVPIKNKSLERIRSDLK